MIEYDGCDLVLGLCELATDYMVSVTLAEKLMNGLDVRYELYHLHVELCIDPGNRLHRPRCNYNIHMCLYDRTHSSYYKLALPSL